MYPWVAPRMARSSSQLLFVGTFPIALATIVSGTALIAVPRFGQWARDLTWALWWIDVALTLASVLGLPVSRVERGNAAFALAAAHATAQGDLRASMGHRLTRRSTAIDAGAGSCLASGYNAPYVALLVCLAPAGLIFCRFNQYFGQQQS